MKDLHQELKNQLAEITYGGIYIYRYILDELRISDMNGYSQIGFDNDTIIEWSDFEEKMCEGYFEAQEFMNKVIRNGLPKKDVLFASSYTRECINGERINSLLDRYIDLIDPDKYILLERTEYDGLSDDIPYHTRNLFLYDDTTVMSYYGVDKIDYKELHDFMYNGFLNIVEDHYEMILPEKYKRFLVARLYNKLQYRRTFISFYKEVLSVVQPKMVVYSHGAMDMMCFLYEAASEAGIPCYEIRHGVNNSSQYISPTARYQDYLLDYTELTNDWFDEKERKRHIAIGKPGIKDNTGAWMGDVAAGGKTVVGVISSGEGDLLELSVALAKKLSPERYVVAYKFHPSERADEKKRNELTATYPNLVMVNSSMNIMQFFCRCEIIFGERSTAVYEALVYERIKLIVYNGVDMIQPAILEKLRENDELVIVSNTEEAASEVLSYQRGANYRPNGEIYWVKDSKERFIELTDRVCNK